MHPGHRAGAEIQGNMIGLLMLKGTLDALVGIHGVRLWQVREDRRTIPNLSPGHGLVKPVAERLPWAYYPGTKVGQAFQPDKTGKSGWKV